MDFRARKEHLWVIFQRNLVSPKYLSPETRNKKSDYMVMFSIAQLVLQYLFSSHFNYFAPKSSGS